MSSGVGGSCSIELADVEPQHAIDFGGLRPPVGPAADGGDARRDVGVAGEDEQRLQLAEPLQRRLAGRAPRPARGGRRRAGSRRLRPARRAGSPGRRGG